MSDLLEKAVIDAKALREVATKNAESLIVEKYSQRIKEAVEQFLEQEDDMIDTEEDVMDTDMSMGMGGGEDMLGATSSEESSIDDQIPMAAINQDGDDEEIEIDFSELERQMGGEKDLSMSDMTDRGEVASELPLPDENNLSDEEEMIPSEEDNLDNISNEMLEEIIEALEVDYVAKPNGYYGSTEVERKESLEGTIAKAQETEDSDEEKEELEKEMVNLNESLKKTENKYNKVIKENKELQESVKSLIEKLNESNIVNAKMLYMNQVLKNISLNEKQKKSFVEEISKVDSVDKAKAIYEALTNSMGVSNSKSPKSLNEIVSRPSVTFPMRPTLEKEISDPFLDRMKQLAGIKKR